MTRLLVSGIQPVAEIHPCFSQFTYTPRSLSDDSTPLVGRDTNRHPPRGSCHANTYLTRLVYLLLICLCLCVYKAIMSMFEDMGFINTFKINMRTLAR